MPARLFLRTISCVKKVPKAFLLSLVLFVLLGSTSKVVAQTSSTQDQQKFDTQYQNYLNLFTNDSGIKYSGLKSLGADGKTAQGLIFGLTLNFDVSDPIKNEEWHWDRITKQGTGSANAAPFVIRVCMTTAKICWLNSIGLTDSKKNITSSNPNINLPVADIIYRKDVRNNYVKGQTLAFNAFVKGTAQASTQYKLDDTTNTVTPFDFNAVTFGPGMGLTADLWYCAGPASKPTEDGTIALKKDTDPKNISNTNVRTFGKSDDDIKLCDGTAYFKIGNTINITIPAQDQLQGAVDAGNKALAVGSTTQANTSNLPECAIGLVGETKIVGCFARGAYYVIYQPLAWIAGFFGRLFDFFIGYSLSDESYRFPFVVTAWRIIRDICNIFFIVILVWTGFSTVFGLSKLPMKKVVPSIIINALLINFSLFATHVVIDLSNIVARVFYGQIKVCLKEGCPIEANGIALEKTDGTGGYKPISEAIVSAFNPQRVFQNNTLLPTEGSSEPAKDVDFNAPSVQVAARPLSADEYAGYFLLITLFAAVIMFFVMKMFWGMAFLFLGRVVGLYVAMIFSPFAFLTMGSVPLVGNIKALKWSDWLAELTNYAILAPFFLFFLYVIYAFMQKSGDFFNLSKLPTNDFIGVVISIAIPMGIIYMLLQKGVDAAKKYGGEIGTMIQKQVDGFTGGVGGVVGGAAAIASGGVALAGTRIGSRIGGAISDSKFGKFMRENAENSVTARGINNALSWTQKSSWDPRKTGAYTKATEAFQKVGDIKVQDKVTGKLASITKSVGAGNLLDFTEKRFEGGMVGQQKRRQEQINKNIDERVNFDNITDSQAEKEWAAQQKKRAAKNIDQNLTPGTKDYEDALAAAIKADEKKYGKVTTQKQYTNAKRQLYVEKLQNDSIWMKNGEPRLDLRFAGGTAGGTAGIISGITSTLTAPLVGVALGGERIRFEQEALAAVAKKRGKAFEKSMGGKSKMDKLENEAKKADEVIDNHIKDHLKADPQNAGKTDEEIDTLVKGMDDDEKDTILNEKKMAAQTNLDAAADDLDTAKKMPKNDPARDKAFKDASRAKQEAQDALDKLKTAREKQRKAQEALEKEKEAEEKKKKDEEAKNAK